MAQKFLAKEFASIHLAKEWKNEIQASVSNVFARISFRIKEQQLNNKKITVKKGKNPVETPENPANPLTNFSRKIFLQQFPEKVKENKEFAMKKIREQRELLRRKQEREEILLQRLSEQEELEEKQKEQERYDQEQQKKDRLTGIKAISERRKNEIQYYREKNSASNRISQSAAPLFKQIEENFYYQVEMPELERRKKELQQKRELYKPISHKEILNHVKKIENLRQELQEKREKIAEMREFDEKIHSLSTNMKSKFIKNVIEESRKQRIEEQEKVIEKKLRVEKKKQYSELVNEMYQPTIDKFKEQEMKLIKARLQYPVRMKLSVFNEGKASEYSRSTSMLSKKWKKNNMLPEKKEKKIGKKILYLEERRKLRDKSEKIDREVLEWEKDIDVCMEKDEIVAELKKKAERLEKAAQKFEMKLNGRAGDMEMSEHVNDLIINSIRAKLAILTT